MAEMTCNTKAQHFVFHHLLMQVKPSSEKARVFCALYVDYVFTRSELFLPRALEFFGDATLHMWDVIEYLHAGVLRALHAYRCFEEDSERFITEHSVSESNFYLVPLEETYE
jgi:hypothetical protein